MAPHEQIPKWSMDIAIPITTNTSLPLPISL